MLLSACASGKPDLPVRIALLAPFEGRYREVGYNALYAARLALRETGDLQVELMPVDDGGTVESGADRARALALDPQVMAVVALGYEATAPDVQPEYGDLPVLIVGNWGAAPTTQNIFILSSERLNAIITAPPRVSMTDAAALNSSSIGGEVYGLEQYALLRSDLDHVHFASSGSLPDTDFEARYQAGEQFAPQPGLLASLTYDATTLAYAAISGAESDETGTSRSQTASHLRQGSFTTTHGTFAFANGYWVDAPIHYFRYDEAGRLRAVDELVE
jgi:ABC-type branched-subunit amino acid transport system substrate-binding protein